MQNIETVLQAQVQSVKELLACVIVTGKGAYLRQMTRENEDHKTVDHL
jgi:hypothetical protein